MKGIYSGSLNKRGQFFILSAVIIASIIVSLASVKNYVSTGDAPKKFYYYSQQLEDETGAVVDYALYNSDSNQNEINLFLQQSVTKTMDAYPEMEIFSCYSDPDNDPSTTYLICQNNGTRTIEVSTVGMPIPLVFYGTDYVKNWECSKLNRDGTCSVYAPKSVDSFAVDGIKYINVTPQGSTTYTVCLQSSSIQKNQFYFLLKMNTSSGDYAKDSSSSRKAIC